MNLRFNSRTITSINQNKLGFICYTKLKTVRVNSLIIEREPIQSESNYAGLVDGSASEVSRFWHAKATQDHMDASVLTMFVMQKQTQYSKCKDYNCKNKMGGFKLLT